MLEKDSSRGTLGCPLKGSESRLERFSGPYPYPTIGTRFSEAPSTIVLTKKGEYEDS